MKYKFHTGIDTITEKKKIERSIMEYRSTFTGRFSATPKMCIPRPYLYGCEHFEIKWDMCTEQHKNSGNMRNDNVDQAQASHI